MLSSARIAAIKMHIVDESFLDRIRMAGKEDDSCTVRKWAGAKPLKGKTGNTKKELGTGG